MAIAQSVLSITLSLAFILLFFALIRAARDANSLSSEMQAAKTCEPALLDRVAARLHKQEMVPQNLA
jgi:hypothetical protein